MTGLPDRPARRAEPRAGARDSVRFTPRGQMALDELASVITNRMARTPEGITRALAVVYRTPLDDLVAAFDSVAERLAAEQGNRCVRGRHAAGEGE